MVMICLATTGFLIVAKNDERDLGKQELLDNYTKPWTISAIAFMLLVDGMLIRISYLNMGKIMVFYLGLATKYTETQNDNNNSVDQDLIEKVHKSNIIRAIGLYPNESKDEKLR